MNLMIIAGFLGSGKTTLLMKTAGEYSRRKSGTLAILENEVGETGVDDLIIREGGLPVKEIYSGCICCSLRLDLISTLLDLEREYNPDLVIMEPSGVASPSKVVDALQGYGGEIDRKIVVTLLDAARMGKLEKLEIPIITDGINSADLVVINKVDKAPESDLRNLETRIRKIRPDADILLVSAASGENLDVLVDKMLDFAIPAKAEKTKVKNERTNGPEPAVFSRKITVDLPESADSEIISGTVCSLLEDMENILEQKGCAVIGHLKAVIQTGKGGYQVFSITDFEEPPQAKGKLPKTIDKYKFTCNLIVYGISKFELTLLAEKELKKLKLF